MEWAGTGPGISPRFVLQYKEFFPKLFERKFPPDSLSLLNTLVYIFIK